MLAANSQGHEAKERIAAPSAGPKLDEPAMISVFEPSVAPSRLEGTISRTRARLTLDHAGSP